MVFHKVVFHVKGDKAGEYRTIKSDYTPKVRDHLHRKYGENLIEILNERITPLPKESTSS